MHPQRMIQFSVASCFYHLETFEWFATQWIWKIAIYHSLNTGFRREKRRKKNLPNCMRTLFLLNVVYPKMFDWNDAEN